MARKGISGGSSPAAPTGRSASGPPTTPPGRKLRPRRLPTETTAEGIRARKPPRLQTTTSSATSAPSLPSHPQHDPVEQRGDRLGPLPGRRRSACRTTRSSRCTPRGLRWRSKRRGGEGCGGGGRRGTWPRAPRPRRRGSAASSTTRSLTDHLTEKKEIDRGMEKVRKQRQREERRGRATA